MNIEENMFQNHFLLAMGKFMIAIYILCMVNASNASSQQFRGLEIVPQEETRSVIRQSNGYYYVGPNESLEVAREKALQDAKLKAVENSKNIIMSKTKLKNKYFDFHLVKNKDGNYVTLLERIDDGFDKKTSKYHVRINAKIEYILELSNSSSKINASEKNYLANNQEQFDKGKVGSNVKKVQTFQPKSLSNLLKEKGSPLTVRVWTEKKQYKEGEKIIIYLQGNHDFFANIIDTDLDGNVIQLLPNKARTNNFFKRGQIYEIPDKLKGDKFEIESSPPFGIDTVTVFASETQLGTTDLIPIGSGLNQFKGTKVKYDKLVSRGVKLLGSDSSQPVEFYKSSWRFETVP